jgi:hypothetical protein
MSDQFSSSVYAPAPVTIEVPKYLRFHWALVMIGIAVVGGFTNAIAGAAWLMVQADWVKKVTGAKKAYTRALISVCLYGAALLTSFGTAGTAARLNGTVTASQSTMAIVSGLILIAAAVMYIVASFNLRTELEGAPFGLKLSGVMTFFFGAIYFQYHLQKLWLPVAGLPTYAPAATPAVAVPEPVIMEPTAAPGDPNAS